MDSAAPTLVTLETDSAWFVILAVSLVTLVAVLIIRRLMARPGGLASGLLLTVPLLLPLIAAVIYQRALLPEISVLKPAGAAILERSEQLFHLFMVNDGDSSVTFYALTGTAGPWIILIGLSVTTFMLLRRMVGTALVHRLIARCVPAQTDHPEIVAVAEYLSRRAGLRRAPEVLILPPGVSGAFAAGARRGKILISEDLVEVLEPDELEAILAHEISHLRSRDVQVVFVAGFLRDLVAWNPFAHLALRKLVRDREFEADRRAASLTERPLSVASGLLKMCEVVQSQRGLGQKAALAFLRPGHRISRRVSSLIEVADGKASAASAGALPFLLAGLLVALLGLQVAAKVATEHPGGLAIMWGAPSNSDGEVWKAPKKIQRQSQAARRAAVIERGTRARATMNLARPIRYPEFATGVRVRESDLGAWLSAVEKRMKASGLSQATLRWEARRDWEAVPILPGRSVGNIGIYRINQQI